MKQLIARFALLVFAALGLGAFAGPLEDANAAYKRGDYAGALAQYRALAVQGNAAAQANLGDLYANGRGVARDDATAVTWFRKAAEQGDTYGESWLADMYAKGRGVARDDVAAGAWFRRCADKGSAYCQAGIAYLYRDSKVFSHDEVAAVGWFRKAAEQGDADAQTTLGYMYEYGRGVAKSYPQAAEWYRKAADRGLARAQVNLGNLYRWGFGVPKDETEAFAWYRKGAEQGDARGQYLVAILYRQGIGVTKDYAEALAWNRKAADQGDAGAQNNLGDMYEDGDGTSQDYGQALAWYRKSADQGHARGEFSLGTLYEGGHGVAQDYAEALKWYRKSADHGDSHAQLHLAQMYENGRGVAKDDAQAVKWYRSAAELGELEAQAGLGALYREGRASSGDLADAVKWARKIPDTGSAKATEVLAALEKQAAEAGVALDTPPETKATEAKAPGGTDLSTTVAALIKANEAALPAPAHLDPKRVALAHQLIEAAHVRDKFSKLDPDADQPAFMGDPLAKLPPRLLDAFRLTMQASFPPEVLPGLFEHRLAETVDVETLEAGLRWENSEVGRRINLLEVDRIKRVDEYRKFSGEVASHGAMVNDPRARACAQADVLQNRTDAMLPLLEALGAGGMMAMFAQQGAQSLDMGAVEQAILSLRPMLREASRQGVLTSCLFELQDLPDAQFEQWLEFLRTDAGGRYARGASAALRDVLLVRAEIFAHVMLEVARQLRTRNEI